MKLEILTDQRRPNDRTTDGHEGSQGSFTLIIKSLEVYQWVLKQFVPYLNEQLIWQSFFFKFIEWTNRKVSEAEVNPAPWCPGNNPSS